MSRIKDESFYFSIGFANKKFICFQEVEPMYKESDHIHIIALSNALNVGVRVKYMDRGEGSQVSKVHIRLHYKYSFFY